MILANAQYWLNYLNHLAEDNTLSDVDLQAATKALDVAATTPEAWHIVLPLTSAIQPYMERRGYWTEWETFLQYLLYYARQQNDLEAQIEILKKLGSIQRRKGNDEAATAAYRQAWRACHHTNQQFNEAVALSNLSDLYRRQGCFWRAEILGRRALRLFEGLDDVMRMAYTENTMGLIFFDQRAWDQALMHYQQAESLFKRVEHNYYGLAMVWQNMGALYNYINDFDHALMVLQRALEYYQHENNTVGVAQVQLNIGTIWLKHKNLSRAEQASLQAETAFNTIGDTINLARVRHNLGMIYTQSRQWDEAERCFERALEQWKSHQDWRNYANTLGELAEMYIRRGNKQKAQYCLDAEAQLITPHGDARYTALKRELETRQKKLAQ